MILFDAPPSALQLRMRGHENTRDPTVYSVHNVHSSHTHHVRYIPKELSTAQAFSLFLYKRPVIVQKKNGTQKRTSVNKLS